MRQLQLGPITAAAFADFGWVTPPPGPGSSPARPINDGRCLRLDSIGELAFDAAGGRPCLALFRASTCDPRGPWQQLERHNLGSQTFVPLGGVRYLMLVTLGALAPDPTRLAAFVVGGDQAVTLRAGTWHHGLIALDDGDFIVVERAAAEPDCELATLAEPVSLLMP